MLTQRAARFAPGALLLAACLAAGCAPGGPAGGMPQMPPPEVPVANPVVREVTDTAEFAARVSAVESVKVRARVWGHVGPFLFTEGAEVKKDDLLFRIDARPYKVAVDRAAAEVERAAARLGRLALESDRARSLGTTRAISREEIDRAVADTAEARQSLESAKAAVESAKLDLQYTEVRAPISGQIGRALVTAGNLIPASDPSMVLTTIVSMDPIHAFFDVDDLATADVRRMFHARKTGGPPVPVSLGLVTETGFPHTGEIDFVDNQVDPATGTLKVRGVFRNPDRVLAPGLFGRVRVRLGRPREAVLITDRAVETDQDKKIVYVVGTGDVAERREVELGGLHDGMREVKKGLGPTDRVVVGAIQFVRPGEKVVPKPESPPARTAGPATASR